MARELRNDELIAEILDEQGDAFYYAGDLKQARAHYAQANAAATKATLRPLQLRSRLNLAGLDRTEGRSVSASGLRALVAEAERLGLRFEAVQGALLAADADLQRNRVQAREQFESALAGAERLGARVLLAKAHHRLASIEAADGNQTAARRHADTARQIVDAIRKDARSDEVLRRSDLRPILESPAQ